MRLKQEIPAAVLFLLSSVVGIVIMLMQYQILLYFDCLEDKELVKEVLELATAYSWGGNLLLGFALLIHRRAPSFLKIATIIWVIVRFSIPTLFVAILVFINLFPSDRFHVSYCTHDRLNSWWPIVPLLDVIGIVLMFIIVSLRSQESGGIFVALVFILPTLLTSAALFFFCRWVVTDPYGLYTTTQGDGSHVPKDSTID